MADQCVPRTFFRLDTRLATGCQRLSPCPKAPPSSSAVPQVNRSPVSVTTHECWSEAEMCTALPPQFSGNIAATSLGPRGVLVSLGSRPATKVTRVRTYQSNLKHRRHVAYFAVTTQISSIIRTQGFAKLRPGIQYGAIHKLITKHGLNRL